MKQKQQLNIACADLQHGTDPLTGDLQADALSYPDNYEVMVDIAQVGRIKVRPFSPEDIALWEALFQSLTPRSVYLRFFCFMKQLSPSMQRRLTCIDPEQEIALVAMLQRDCDQIMVGDARVIETQSRQSAEFSVLVADHYQGKGIGACLLSHCLDIARKRGIRHIFGMVLADNIQMLALGRKLGFSVVYCQGSREYELSKVFPEPNENHE
jgi:acetyltransferase